jgi:hypothetical protein
LRGEARSGNGSSPPRRCALVCPTIRSRNAGAFWITLDLFFDGEDNYARFRDARALSSEAVARTCGSAAHVRRYPVGALQVLEISYPRAVPQGAARIILGLGLQAVGNQSREAAGL